MAKHVGVRRFSSKSKALLVLFCSITFLISPISEAVPAPPVRRVSVGVAGVQATATIMNPVISADGQYVAFYSTASNLVPGDTNDKQDVFVRDLVNATTIRVSVDSSGVQASGNSSIPAISDDGRFVAFHSSATNLVPDDTNGQTDIFVRDTIMETTTRVSISSAEEQGNRASSWSSISMSADGRFIVFGSGSSNLVPGDTNNIVDVFVRDNLLGTTERVSVSSSGVQGNAASDGPVISADGQHISFRSEATNLVSDDANGSWDTFVRHISAGTTERVSVDSSEVEAEPHAANYLSLNAISGDGRYVVFTSYSRNLVPLDNNRTADVFLRDTQAGTTTRASVGPEGVETLPGEGGGGPAITPDGRYIAFTTTAAHFAPIDTNGVQDVILRDMQTGTLTRVSVNSSGAEANGSSKNGLGAITSDGRAVVFTSNATNLVADDTNGIQDAFVYGFTVADGSKPECGPDGEPPTRTDVPTYCESAYDDALEFPDPDEIHDQVIAAIGEERYADMWIDRTLSPSMLRVGVVDPTPADELALDTITGTPTRVTAVDVKYSSSILQGYLDTAAPSVRAMSIPYGISIDPEINKVLIEMPTVDASLVSEILLRDVPADAFVITPGYEPPKALHSRRDQYPNYESGLAVGVKQGPNSDYAGQISWCTGSWMGSWNYDFYGLTAGHCETGDEGGAVYMGSYSSPTQVAATGANTFHQEPDWCCYWTNSDTLRFKVPDAYVTARMLVGKDRHRYATAPRYYTGPDKGTKVCWQGRRTGGGNCGTVTRANKESGQRQSEFHDNTFWTHFHTWTVRVDDGENSQPPVGGDSGGPVYRVMDDGSVKPAGALWGGSDVPSAGYPNGYMVFHGIKYMLSDLSAGGGVHDLIYAYTRG